MKAGITKRMAKTIQQAGETRKNGKTSAVPIKSIAK
jgi:hypothetical protein